MAAINPERWPHSSRNAGRDQIGMLAALARISQVVNEPYLIHPFQKDRYLLMTGYTQEVYAEKIRCFSSLLTDLAIKKYSVRYVKGFSSFAGVDASVTEGNDSFKSGVEGRHQSKLEFTTIGEFTPTQKPQLPDPVCNPWYAHEPSWQALADSVVRGGATRLKFQFQHDLKGSLGLTVTTALETILASVKMKAEFSEETVWEMDLQF